MTLLGTHTAHDTGAAGTVSSGDGGDDAPEIPRFLIPDSPPVAIAALDSPWHAKDFFSVGAAHGLFGSVDRNFMEIFGGRILGVRPARRLARHALLRVTGLDRIQGGLSAVADTDLHAVADLVLRSNLLERGFGGLDDTPPASGLPPRKNLFRIDGWWIALFYEKRLWHVAMPNPDDIFQGYTKVFMPCGDAR